MEVAINVFRGGRHRWTFVILGQTVLKLCDPLTLYQTTMTTTTTMKHKYAAQPTKWTRSPPIGRAKQNAAPLKLKPKPSEVAFSVIFQTFHKCRPEVAGNVISSVAIDYVGVDVRAKFSDSRSKRSWHIRAIHFMMDEWRQRTMADTSHHVRQNAIRC